MNPIAAKSPTVIRAAKEALNTIAETGREALSEMRRLVGVLRDEPSQAQVDFSPAPTLSDIPELVSRASDRASLEVRGQPPRVPAALALTETLDEDVVDFVPNYDNSLTQPEVLPSAFPNLLVNGASGIAVGMATNMAPQPRVQRR